MPFRVKGSEELDSRITLRVTSKEKAKLQEDAELAGLSVSELIRRRYFGRPIVADVDMTLIRELRRQGGLLRHAMGASLEADKEIIQAVVSVRNYVEWLASGKQRHGR